MIYEYFKIQWWCYSLGGEPLLQTPFLVELIKELKKNNINIIVETNLSLSLNNDLINLVDCFYIDIKSLDDKKHKKWTKSF